MIFFKKFFTPWLIPNNPFCYCFAVFTLITVWPVYRIHRNWRCSLRKILLTRVKVFWTKELTDSQLHTLNSFSYSEHSLIRLQSQISSRKDLLSFRFSFVRDTYYESSARGSWLWFSSRFSCILMLNLVLKSILIHFCEVRAIAWFRYATIIFTHHVEKNVRVV